MRSSIASTGIVAAMLLAGLGAPGRTRAPGDAAAPVAPSVAGADPVEDLANAIIVRAGTMPAQGGATQMEARLALMVDAARLSCPDTVAALRRAAARSRDRTVQRAIRGVEATLRDCGQGTGDIGDGFGRGLAPIPSFGTGGGTDYRS